MHMRSGADIHTSTHTHTESTPLHVHTHTYICTCTQVQTYTHVHTHLHTHTQKVHLYTYTLKPTYAHALRHRHSTYVHISIHPHTHTEACIHVLTHSYTHSYTHSGQGPWYLALHAPALRCEENASIVRHGKWRANLLPASGSGVWRRAWRGAPCCRPGCGSWPLSNERWQFPQSKLVEPNQTN